MAAYDLSGARWRKSSRSGGAQNCVELAYGLAVRDSKNPAGPAIVAAGKTYGALIAAVREGNLDR